MKTTTHINEKELGELLKAYYEGNLSTQEINEVEALAQQDEFLADAMEGFNQFPEAISSIPSFKSTSTSYLWATIIGLTLVTLIGSYIYFTNAEKSSPSLATTQVVIPEAEPEKTEALINEITTTEDLTPENTVALIPKVKKDKKPVQTQQKEVQEREHFEIPKMELNPIEIKQKTTYTLKKAKTKAIGYYNFLAVDYSVIYTNSIPVEAPLSGTDASMAHKADNSINLYNGEQQKTLTYKQFLKQSFFYLNDKNYSKAIENFNIILSHYPDDANAEFYIGYALFYQNKPEEAIPYFDKAMNNGFDFFFEDAQWFKANALENLGKLKEAQQLYKEIKTKGGYYSYQVK